jgi:glycosyltransferase involved in cell wall biosynthesis
MPIRNAEPFIAAAISSILTQLGPDDEIVVQDGLSTDATLDRLHAAAGGDARVRVRSERDSGQSDALNRALARAGGDYVCWLNGDDVIESGAITAVRAALRVSPDVVIGSHAVVDERGRTIARYRSHPLSRGRLLREGCYVFSGSLVIRRDVLLRLGGFPTDSHYAMDLDLMLRIASEDGLRSVEIPATIGTLRWHDASKSGSQTYAFAREGWAVRRRYAVSMRENLLGAYGAGVQLLSIATTPLRHSRMWQLVRGMER